MWKAFFGLVFAVSLAVSGVQLASAAPAKDYVKKKVFDFDGDNIEGALLTPEGEFLGGRGKVVHVSLSEYRMDFIPEMLKTAEDL